MEKAEEVYHFLEEFSIRKPKIIPQELNEYLAYVARTGDPVYPWGLIKCLFKEKLLNVISDFYETSPGIDIPPYPNVDPFNYDIMKNSLLERLDSFTAAPFTVQRICELLTYPRKQYNRIDKYMRAVEKNILVVSTREPGQQRQPDIENGEPVEPIMNGSDNNSEYNVDVEMEDMSWKENRENQLNTEPQPSSSEVHITVDDIEVRLQAKKEDPMEIPDRVTTEYESVTPPEPNISADDPVMEDKPNDVPHNETSNIDENKTENTISTKAIEKTIEEDIKPSNDVPPQTHLVIPEIKVDDAEMTEQKLKIEADAIENEKATKEVEANQVTDTSTDTPEELTNANIDDSSSDTNIKDEKDIPETKVLCEVSTSSEESSSSSDNTDGNSNSPKTDSDSQNQEDLNTETFTSHSIKDNSEELKETLTDKISELINENDDKTPESGNNKSEIQSENYSISDVSSEIKVPSPKIEEAPKTVTEDIKADTPEPTVNEIAQTETNTTAEEVKEEVSKE